MVKISKRQLAYVARARAVVKDLLDSLGATTSYATREPRRRVKLPWRALYGWQLAFTAKKGGVLDADGKPTQIELVPKWSHNPGDIVTSGQVDHIKHDEPFRYRELRPRRYMVREDHSLRAI